MVIDMITNIPGITIWEWITVDRAPAYIRHTTADAYWQPSYGETDGKDRTPDNSVFVSIPATSTDYCPKTDDRVVSGIIDDDLPPKTALTVSNVKDLRAIGSPRVQHIELILK